MTLLVIEIREVKNCQHLDAWANCKVVGNIFSITVETFSLACQNVHASTEEQASDDS
jgi:hypothetical protein